MRREQREVLEGAPDAERGDLVGSGLDDGATLEEHVAGAAACRVGSRS